jgi:uroporphyrinogen decarboxylase
MPIPPLKGNLAGPLPLESPSPDFKTFEQVLRGGRAATRVHFVELWIDEEIVRYITEQMLGERWVTRREGGDLAYWEQMARFYFRMGYDYVPIQPFEELEDIPSAEREGDDTAALTRGKRVWAEEGRGVIRSWEDFERFPWDRVKLNVEVYRQLAEGLPPGMKIVFWEARGLFEFVLENLLGYEGLFFALYDQPDLVEAVFETWGSLIERIYREVISIENVGALFHADDLAYKSGTLVNPDVLRRLVFPWFARYADLAHEHGKLYWCHSCGNVLGVMEDLIQRVGIDAFHSFQDVIVPVTEFQKRYGDRIAVLGGVDVDKLCRMETGELRSYVRGILDSCMEHGRYALGSGNSIANYVPVENYLTMLEEGLRWRP